MIRIKVKFILSAFLLILLILLILSLSGCLKKVGIKDYIGLKYLECPKGLIDNGGWVQISDKNLCISNISKGKTNMLWLEKTFLDQEKKVKYYLVLDVLTLPKMTKKEIVCSYCSIEGKYIPNIIAIAEYEETKANLSKIKYAWRINKRTLKFIQINTDNIICRNDTYGI